MPIISGSGGGTGGLGGSTLIYRYTVAGASKASIDTGVDAAQAGSGVWAGDTLEIVVFGQTAAVAVLDSVNLTFNNDSGANYDRQYCQGASATASANTSVAQTSLALGLRGAGGLAAQAGTITVTIPGFTSAAFNKAGQSISAEPDSTGANEAILTQALAWRSTAAISRVKIVGSGGNLNIGTMLAIYARTAS